VLLLSRTSRAWNRYPVPALFHFQRSIIVNNETPTQPIAAEPVPSGATGPRTEAGKAASSQNARKHDLCSRTLRLSPEEWDEYNDMRERYARDLEPADNVEETLVDEICFNYWRLQQARGAELGIVDKHSTQLHLIALYIRYRTSYERAFYKALDQIQKRQRDRRKQAISPSPVRSAESECDPAATPLAATPLAAAVLAPVRSVDSAEIQSLTLQIGTAHSRKPGSFRRFLRTCRPAKSPRRPPRRVRFAASRCAAPIAGRNSEEGGMRLRHFAYTR
jgi:hypothetical protein